MTGERRTPSISQREEAALLLTYDKCNTDWTVLPGVVFPWPMFQVCTTSGTVHRVFEPVYIGLFCLVGAFTCICTLFLLKMKGMCLFIGFV